jgi:hypothetical protein
MRSAVALSTSFVFNVRGRPPRDLDELLRDGRCARGDSTARDAVGQSAAGRNPIDTAVLIKALSLRREHRIDDVTRDFVDASSRLNRSATARLT